MLEREPVLSDNYSWIKPFSDKMKQMNPRTQILASNLALHTCTQYLLSADQNQNLMVFKLSQPTYVQYVHATGEGDDGLGTSRGTEDESYQFTYTGSELDQSTCSDFNNRYWYAAKVYVSNTDSLNEAQLCGYAGSTSLLENTSITADQGDKMLELLKTGGSVKCPEDVGASQYVIIHLDGSGGDLRRPCNVGIFSCECSNYEAIARS